MTKCRSCGAPIVFGITEKGRRMPLDAAPSSVDTPGVWVLSSFGDAAALARLEPSALRGSTLHVPHWATCPNATKHRKRGAA